VHHALCFRPIDDFPRFANARSRRQAPAELRFKSAPAPDAFHKKRFKGEGTGEIALGHSFERNCSDSEAGCDWFVMVDRPLRRAMLILADKPPFLASKKGLLDLPTDL
jgi:hypothetical protein